MNTLFLWDVQNQHPSSYNTLLEMMSHEIINDELIDHRNKARKRLPPLRGNVKSQVFAYIECSAYTSPWGRRP